MQQTKQACESRASLEFLAEQHNHADKPPSFISASQCNYPRASPLPQERHLVGVRVLDRHGSAPAETEQHSPAASSRRRCGGGRDPDGDRRRRNRGTGASTRYLRQSLDFCRLNRFLLMIELSRLLSVLML